MTISRLIAVVTGSAAVINSGETQGPFGGKRILSRTDPGAAWNGTAGSLPVAAVSAVTPGPRE